MSFKDAQEQVHQWVSQFKTPYFAPSEMMVCLMEEVGELSKEVNHRFGPKRKKNTEELQEFGDEMGDILFALICLANSQGVSLEAAFQKTMNKYTQRDKDRFEKKEI